ncbi:phage portal protein [Bacillaceae bacterium SIJ1]|uniref:phage portal protein n=1 Tax=Litoribacterium kuwaitense TaxID=1398745 RepID=UPI0013ED93A2|nr:phage portal protein [Litoribacterium kuwaitense]NGP45979.1 phage portal protein [Litoribacterium kuwaitense]
MAIRFFTYEDIVSDKDTTEIYVYTKDRIFRYEKKNEDVYFVDEQPHFFEEVPIVPYWNKEEGGKGDFEDILSLNDAYNLLQSDDINESNYSNDAYLIIKGMDVKPEDVSEMKEKRAIEVTEDGDVQWLTKQLNDAWKENLKNRIVEDIHKISGTPDVTDDNFAGNASGVSMRYKLLPFENNRSQKEREFKKGLQRRIRLITNMLNKQGHNYNWRDVQMTFTPNLPVNEKEEIDSVIKLAGTKLVSMDTLRNYLSIVDDSQLEKEKIDQEHEELLEQEGQYTIEEALKDEAYEELP